MMHAQMRARPGVDGYRQRRPGPGTQSSDATRMGHAHPCALTVQDSQHAKVRSPSPRAGLTPSHPLAPSVLRCMQTAWSRHTAYRASRRLPLGGLGVGTSSGRAMARSRRACLALSPNGMLSARRRHNLQSPVGSPALAHPGEGDAGTMMKIRVLRCTRGVRGMSVPRGACSARRGVMSESLRGASNFSTRRWMARAASQLPQRSVSMHQAPVVTHSETKRTRVSTLRGAGGASDLQFDWGSELAPRGRGEGRVERRGDSLAAGHAGRPVCERDCVGVGV